MWFACRRVPIKIARIDPTKLVAIVPMKLAGILPTGFDEACQNYSDEACWTLDNAATQISPPNLALPGQLHPKTWLILVQDKFYYFCMLANLYWMLHCFINFYFQKL